MKITREANLMFEELSKKTTNLLLREVMVKGKGESMKLIEYHLWRQNLKL